MQQRQQNWENQFALDKYNTGLEQQDYQNMLAMAQEMAKYGDFSGYQALGIDTSTMEQRYAQEQAAANAKRYSGGGTTPGSGKDKPSMSLSTAKLYANNGIWDDAVLDVFHKNGYTDALLTAEYGYDPYASPFKDATGNARFKASGVQFSDAEYADFQYQVGMTRDDQGRLAMIQDAYKEKKITEAQANALLKQYGLSG